MPIPGTTQLHRLKENVGATTIELTTTDLIKIGDVLGRMPVVGERYAEESMRLIDR